MNGEHKIGWCGTLTYVSLGILFVLSMIGSCQTQYIIFVAAIMSAIWVTWYRYDYNSEDQILLFGRFNLMTWIVWTVGLITAAMFYNHLVDEGFSLPQRVWLTAVLWSVCISAIEWIGYNLCNIKLKSNYPGLLGLDLMHGPWYLKIYYLTAWAIFITVLGMW